MVYLGNTHIGWIRREKQQCGIYVCRYQNVYRPKSTSGAQRKPLMLKRDAITWLVYRAKREERAKANWEMNDGA